MNQITIEAEINAPIEKVWDAFTKPEHIVHWAFASDDWYAPSAENDVKVGGKFKTVMSAKDKSFSFDFAGTYTEVEERKKISYVMSNDSNDASARKCEITFSETKDGKVKITESFDIENENSEEKQRAGWQAILENFKKYTEALS